MAKETDAINEKLGKGRSLDLSEIGDPGPIEKVTDSDFIKKEIEIEAFMNDILTVVVHEDSNDNAVENPCPSVNGLNQPFIRGQRQKVRRKYVEALASGRMTKYEQKTPDPTKPDVVQMTERSALVYPFTVVHDPRGDAGRKWLDGILAQPY